MLLHFIAHTYPYRLSIQQMNTPNLHNINRLKQRILNARTDKVTLSTEELRGVCADIDALYAYTIAVQADKLTKQSSDVQELEIISDGDFFGPS